MNSRAISAVLIVIAMALPEMTQAKTYQLDPSTKWEMNYQPDNCTLARNFGQGDETVTAKLVRRGPGNGFDLRLIGKLFQSTQNRPLTNIRFGDLGAFVNDNALAGTAGTLPMLFLHGRLDNLDSRKFLTKVAWSKSGEAAQAGMDRIDSSVENAVKSVTIQISGKEIVLKLGGMGPPMAALRNCTSELVRTWGLNPAEQEQALSHAVPKNYPGGWLTIDDYPSESLAKGERGIVNFRLAVDATGQVTDCVVQSSISADEFRKLSCDLIKRRARFEPARSREGKSIPSYYISSVRWTLG